MVHVAVASPPGGASAPREEAPPRPPPPPAPRNGTPPSKHGFTNVAVVAIGPTSCLIIKEKQTIKIANYRKHTLTLVLTN